MPTCTRYACGDTIDYTPSSAKSAGDAVVLGNLVGICGADIEANVKGSLDLSGVWWVPKATGGALTAGTIVYWDSGNTRATSTPSTFKKMGVVVEDAASNDTAVLVKLDGFATMTSQIVGTAAGKKFAAGEVTLDGSNPTTVATGLTTIAAAGVSLKSATAPGDDPSWLSANYTGSDGNLDVYAWKNTGGNDPTLVASTNSSAVVCWWAYGT